MPRRAQLFAGYEAYLRALVRAGSPTASRAKFDSTDVLQSVWVHVLGDAVRSGRRFASREHLRSFLLLVTRHRLTDRQRHFRGVLASEASAPDASLPSTEPRPSEHARANDLWRRLLDLCPPAHHELLRLKRQGYRLAEIAARTGLPEASLRRLLRKLARAAAGTAAKRCLITRGEAGFVQDSSSVLGDSMLVMRRRQMHKVINCARPAEEFIARYPELNSALMRPSR